MAMQQPPSILVKFANSSRALVMVIRRDYNPHESSVVFADPAKLAPYMRDINQQWPAAPSQPKQAREAFRHASIDLHHGQPDVNEDEYIPVPLAKVNCFRSVGQIYFNFSDGITRTTELLNLQAETIPLQIATEEAALLHELVGGEQAPLPASQFQMAP